MANEIGKRFECESCGCQVLCVKAGDGTFACCGSAMKLEQPKVLPSSD